MPTLEPTSPPLAGTGEGIASVDLGQAGAAPAASVSTQGSSDQPRPSADSAPAAPTEQAQPAGTSDIGWKTLADAERDYKALQAYSTKVAQALKGLGNLEVLQRERQIMSQLREDPEFISWVEARLAKEQAGADDPDTVKALQIVDERARQLVEQELAPLRAAHVEQKTRTIFSELDTKYGKEWREQRGRMGELHRSDIQRGIVSPQADARFDFAYVEGLYQRVLGSDPEYAAKQYQRRLAQKQAQATQGQSGPAPQAVTAGKADSLEAAYAAAKRQLNMA